MKDRNIIDQIGEDVVLLDEDGKENTFEHILTFMCFYKSSFPIIQI